MSVRLVRGSMWGSLVVVLAIVLLDSGSEAV